MYNFAMNIGIEYIFVIVAFVAVIMMASYDSAIVPYRKEELFPRHFAYEGMEVKGNVMSSLLNPMDSMKPISQSMKPTSESMNPTSMNHTSQPMNPTDYVLKKESFTGISPYSVNTPETPLDPLSQIQGSKTCDFNSAIGYSNSMGPLCIDDSTMKLLRTRGGNQSGVPSQIG